MISTTFPELIVGSSQISNSFRLNRRGAADDRQVPLGLLLGLGLLLLLRRLLRLRRRAALEALGIQGIDQSAFNGFASRDDSRAFSKEVKKVTGGEGMHIVCDMLRGPVYNPGLAAASRMGVNVSAGDIDADGYDEIITGAGPGAVFGPHVRAFDFDGTAPVVAVPGVSYFAYGTMRYGVNVAAGDLDAGDAGVDVGTPHRRETESPDD